MFIVLKRKKVAAVLAALIISQVALSVFLCLKLFFGASVSLIDFTVVLDAGHGGVDGGVVGNSGVKESDLNLAYAKETGRIFADCGFGVVYTRKDAGGLYGLATNGFKRRDMEKRREIIRSSSANIVISIHMNKFPQKTRSGPQVFYQEGREDGKALADSMQKAFNNFTGNSHAALAGDFFICRESPCPAVIVECGFISNPYEESLLCTDDYRGKLCQIIFNGVMLYLYSAE